MTTKLEVPFSTYRKELKSIGIENEDIVDLQKRWNEPWRFYHTTDHLQDILNRIEKTVLSEKERKMMIAAAFFHDAVYQPWNVETGLNERQSATLFHNVMGVNMPLEELKSVKEIILATANREQPTSELPQIFWLIDNSIVYQSSFEQLLEWEEKIFKEFQFVPYSLYKKARIEFIESCYSQATAAAEEKLEHLVTHIKKRKIKIGVYPGSFHPFHLGHLNVVEKAERIFDKVVIAKGLNPEKDLNTECNIDNNYHVRYRQYDSFDGLLVDYLDELEGDSVSVTLIRGLRNGKDLDYEINVNFFNQKLKEDLNVVYIHCDKEFENISSSAIRGLLRIDARSLKLAQKYLPK